MDKIHWISIQMYYIVAILVLKSCDNVSFKLMMMIETRPRGLWCQFERCCLTGCLTGGVSLVRLLCCAVSLVLVLVLLSHWCWWWCCHTGGFNLSGLSIPPQLLMSPASASLSTRTLSPFRATKRAKRTEDE